MAFPHARPGWGLLDSARARACGTTSGESALASGSRTALAAGLRFGPGLTAGSAAAAAADVAAPPPFAAGAAAVPLPGPLAAPAAAVAASLPLPALAGARRAGTCTRQ